ncbi:MAG: DUF4129 domain-containing protein [Anaerolineae bacterium]|nr:DUF4129 domain-containing protein [Anaerolineae bacterium]
MSRNVWVEDVFRPLAVGGMLGCIALSLVHLIRVFFPDWNGAFMVVGSVVATVEANYSYRLVRSKRLREWDLVRFRAAEIALFLVLLKAGSYVGDPWTEVIRDIRAWPQDPLQILDLEVLYAFTLVLLSWSASTRTTYDLERIGEPPLRDKYYEPPVEALVGRFFWGGMMLLWVAGLTRIGIGSLLNLSRPAVPGIILNVLIYYVLGLVMLGQIQFAQLTLRWRNEGLELPGRFSGHWIRYTLVFLGLAALVAFLLPTAYTLPLLDVVAIVVQAVLYVANVIFQLVLLGFLLLLMPLARLLGGEIRSHAPDPGPPPQLQPATPGGSTPPWFQIVRSVVFWAFALAVVWYVVRSYLRDRPELAASLARVKVFQAARRALRAFWRRLTHFIGAAGDRIPKQLRLLQRRRDGDGGLVDGERFRFFHLGARSGKEKLLYYYLSILRRAARQGYPRGQSQTPYEYDRDLGPNIPGAKAELDRLTDAFVEVRYSRNEVDDEREQHVRADWKRVRTALRSLGRRTEPEAKTETDESN